MIQHHFLTRAIFALSILASSTLLTTVSLTSTQIASANNTQTSYPFPGRAEDLAPGSYWYFRDIHAGGTKALDLVGVRFNKGSGKWTSYNKEGVNSSNDSNEDHIIYNTSVRAIADGEVLACWRNAPSNPRPGESHPGRLSTVKTISRSGNFLVVKMANENRTVLYAHLKPGTVPASLCPFNNEFMQNADKKGSGDYPLESVIPAAQRPKVKQGQIIGRVGNVGASSGPHLHIDRSDILGTNDEGVPLPINFHGAWVKNITNLQNDATKDWEVLDGKELVTPKTAILPSYSSGRPELNKAAVSADDFQFVFNQAIKSGYRPIWIDGYNVNGKTYYNAIFRPADTTPWVAKHGLTASQYQTEFNQRIQQGFVPEQVESYLDGNNIRYSAIFVKKGGPAFKAYHGKTAQEHQKLFDSYTKEGFIPANISVVSVGGQRYYTTLYEKVNVGSLEARSFLTASEYQSESDQNKAAGRQLVYLNAYTHGGGVRFSAIWQSGVSGAFVARHGLSGSEYQAEWNKFTNQDYLTHVVTGYENGNSANFAALWRK